MYGRPPFGAWLALAGLWGVVIAGYALGMRARRQATGQSSATPAATELPDPVVARAQIASLAVAVAPAAVAIVLGVPWQSLLWWLVFVLPASVALASLATPPCLVVLGRAAAERTPGRTGRGGVGPLASAAALAVIATAAVGLGLTGADVRLAVAGALAGGYGLWRAAYATRSR